MSQLTLLEIKNRILSYSASQKGHHNNNCDAKLHTTVEGRLTTAQVDFVDITTSAIENLSASEFASLKSSLPDSDQLSGWPC